MRRVLIALLRRNSDIGYCQGFNFICYYLMKLGFEEE